MIREAKTYRQIVDEIIPKEDESGESSCWPQLAEEAYHGPAGDTVKILQPYTEADPVSLLISFLAEFGVMVGRDPHLVLDGSYHPLLTFPVLVGKTAKSRKGSSGKRIKSIVEAADQTWTRGRYKGTLSSGEGLVWAVRDPVYQEKDGEPALADTGVTDKRIYLVQSEFGAVLRVMARDGNSLSGVIRDAWDGEDLAPMTKGNRIRATAPHVGIVGHVTADELLRHLTDTEACNGFGNRFIWFLVRRSKEIPFPSVPDQSNVNPLIIRLRQALDASKAVRQITLTKEAMKIW